MGTMVGILVGAAIAAGLALVYLAFRPLPSATPLTVVGVTGRRRQFGMMLTRRDRVTALAGTGAGLVFAVLTGWIVTLVLVPVAAVLLPRLLGGEGPNQQRIERLSALEEWTRTLNGMLGSSAGMTEALTATLRSCPAPVRPQVERLVTRLQVGRRAEDALRAFADDLDDPVGDLIAATLILGATQSGTGLRAILNTMAAEVAKEVSIRRTIEAERAGPAREVRILTVLVVGGMTAFIGFTTFGSHYASPMGQVILTGLIAAFFGCLMWIKWLSVPAPEPRFLTDTAQVRKTLW